MLTDTRRFRAHRDRALLVDADVLELHPEDFAGRAATCNAGPIYLLPPAVAPFAPLLRVVAPAFDRGEVAIPGLRLPPLVRAIETLADRLLAAPCVASLERLAGGAVLDASTFVATRAELYRTACALAGVAFEGWRRRGALRLRRR